ncbi:MAG: insulinase family protein [Thiotrichales bacterium]|jgi:zinc protease|nr:insulinase family protein [Thiotrichales bacterium]
MLSIKKIMVWMALTASLPLYAGEVSQFTLANGLHLLVKEDHRAPVVTTQVWYKVGASYEPDGITGISHMLEHMMFKGTKHLKPGELSKIIARLGGSENAFTSQDYTAYFQNIEKSHLGRMFELEAERMGQLKLLDTEFQKERQVVLEERRMRTEDQPTARFQERFDALAYDVNPYRRPVIGWQSDIEHYQLSDLQAWYDRWYAPNNATLVVVGDVNPDAVYRLAQKKLGKVPARQLGESRALIDLVPVAEKRMTMIDERAKVPSLLMGFMVPSWKTAEDKTEAYALDVLANVLDGGNSARLSKELVRGKQLLSQVGAEYDLYARLSTQFMLSAVPADGVSLAQAEDALKASIADIAQNGVTDVELRRIIAQVEAAKVYEQDSMFYQGMKLGQAATVGIPLTEVDAYITKLRAVTPEQVQAVAKKFLVDNRLTVAYLLPKTQQVKSEVVQ